MEDLLKIQPDTLRSLVNEADEEIDMTTGSGDCATVKALEVQGKYVTHSESVSVQATTEDRQ